MHPNLEKIQRQAARFVTRDYRSRDPGCVTQMLEDLNLPTLQARRRNLRLTLLFKIAEGLLPGIPPDKLLTPMKPKRKIKAKYVDNGVSSNIVDNYKTNNSRPFTIPPNKGSEQFKFSFFFK